MSDPLTPTVEFKQSPLAGEYNKLFDDISKQTGLHELHLERDIKMYEQLRTGLLFVDQATVTKIFNYKYPELAKRITELEGLTEKITKERILPTLAETLQKAGAPLDAIAQLDGDSKTLSKDEMQVAHDVLKDHNPLKVHALSDSQEGVSVQDIQNALKDRQITECRR